MQYVGHFDLHVVMWLGSVHYAEQQWLFARSHTDPRYLSPDSTPGSTSNYSDLRNVSSNYMDLRSVAASGGSRGGMPVSHSHQSSHDSQASRSSGTTLRHCAGAEYVGLVVHIAS